MPITMSITSTMSDHDLVHDHDDNDDLNYNDDLDDNDDLVQVLHALLRALHQESERSVEEKVSLHARGRTDHDQRMIIISKI